MADLVRTTITLTPQLNQFVENCCACGDYASTSEVIRAALRLLKQQQPQFDPLLTASQASGSVGVDGHNEYVGRDVLDAAVESDASSGSTLADRSLFDDSADVEREFLSVNGVR